MSPKEKQFLSIIAAVAILVGGYVWASKNLNRTTPHPQGGGNMVDETSGWKIYKNDNYGFEVKYPGDWSEKVTNNGDYFLILEKNYGNGNGSDQISFSEWPNQGSKEKNLNYVDTELKRTLVAERYRTFNGSNWSGLYTPADNSKQFSEGMFIISDGRIYAIDSLDRSGTLNNTLFLKILFTFKFIDTTSQIEYKNSEYGFSLAMSAGWQGYSVTKSTWKAENIDPNVMALQEGTQIQINNPKGEKWQPIPIMIFTPQQWQLVEEGKISVSAAPIAPSKLGENTKYVFALPPRWVGFTDLQGQGEAQEIVKTFKAF